MESSRGGNNSSVGGQGERMAGSVAADNRWPLIGETSPGTLSNCIFLKSLRMVLTALPWEVKVGSEPKP